MTKTKDQYGKILENQQQLMETLTENANKLMELYRVGETPDVFKTEAVDEYLKESRTFMEEVAKPESLEKFWEKWPETVNRAIEMQSKLWQKGMDAYRSFWESNTIEDQKEKLEKAKVLYEENFKAISETTTKNIKVIRGFLDYDMN